MSKHEKWKDEDDSNDATEKTYASRTERTAATHAVNKMGVRLAGFSPTLLDRLNLPEELREAIDLCQKLNLKSRRRQERTVSQILRNEDHEAIAQRIEALDIKRPGRRN